MTVFSPAYKFFALLPVAKKITQKDSDNLKKINSLCATLGFAMHTGFAEKIRETAAQM